MPLPCKMRATILKCVILRIISDCAIDLVAALSAFARAGKIDQTVPDCLAWFLNDFADATIISVPEWQAKISKLGSCGIFFPGPVYTKVVSRFVEEFLDAGMSREFFKAVWARCMADGTGMETTPSLAE